MLQVYAKLRGPSDPSVAPPDPCSLTRSSGPAPLSALALVTGDSDCSEQFFSKAEAEEGDMKMLEHWENDADRNLVLVSPRVVVHKLL